MENQRIEPEKITKPIQLMAVWFVALILINAQLFAAAKLIQVPDWIPPFLIIFAIVFVLLFIGGIFLMQTVFRKQLLSDVYYAKWLDKQAKEGQISKETAVAAADGSKFKRRSLMEYMILNTLWTKQINRWPDLSLYYTFTMNFPTFSEQQVFREAVAKLTGEGLIAELENGQYLLTISGFDYCKNHYYEFPKEQWWPEEQINEENLKKVIE